MHRLTPILLLGLVACATTRDDVLDDLEVDAPDIDGEDVPDGATVYELDTSADPELVFAAVGATGPQHGTWSQYNVRVVQPGDTLEDLRITVVVEMDSVVTAYTALDNHLRSDDFFDVANHPTGQFVSTGIADNGDGTFTVTGDMTLRGTTNELDFVSTIAKDDSGLHATAEIAFSRWEYGLIEESAEEPGDDGVDDLVVLDYDVRLVE